MGNELAKLVSHKDKSQWSQIKRLLEQRKSEIDDDFYAQLDDESNKYVQREEPEAAIQVLRVFYQAGQVAGSTYHRAAAHLKAAIVFLNNREADSPESQSSAIKQSIDRLLDCTKECSSTRDPRCAEIEASAYEMLGQIYLREHFEPDPAHDYFKKARSLFESLQRRDAVERIQGHLADISNTAIRTNIKPLTRMLDDVRHVDELLPRLEAELKEKQAYLTQIEAEMRELGPTVNDLKEQYKALRSQNEELKARVQFLTTAVQVPLWVAVIRSELDSGTLSQLTCELLERMRAPEPAHAEPLRTEIQARSGLPTDTLRDLSGVAGEQRLFAGILNSRALESTDWVQSVEVLVDAWEIYLKDLTGGDRSPSEG